MCDVVPVRVIADGRSLRNILPKAVNKEIGNQGRHGVTGTAVLVGQIFTLEIILY